MLLSRIALALIRATEELESQISGYQVEPFAEVFAVDMHPIEHVFGAIFRRDPLTQLIAKGIRSLLRCTEENDIDALNFIPGIIIMDLIEHFFSLEMKPQMMYE